MCDETTVQQTNNKNINSKVTVEYQHLDARRFDSNITDRIKMTIWNENFYKAIVTLHVCRSPCAWIY